MDKYKLFTTALKQHAEFRDYKQEELIAIGNFFGGDYVAFKEMYKAYLNKAANYENDPMIGAKVEINFDWKKEEVIIKQLEKELIFTAKDFLHFLNLIDICFSDVYPVGTVVELDLDMMPRPFRRMYTDSEALVSILGRKVPLGEGLDYYVDYVGRLWPFGVEPLTPPLFLSNVLIKRVVFTGMIDEAEEKFVEKVLRSDVIDSKEKSTVYLTEEEKKEIQNYIQSQGKKEV